MTATAQDWRRLPAGRELDEVVAVRVMGLTLMERWSPENHSGYETLTLCGVKAMLEPYSTGLAGAFEVLDQLGGVVTLKRLSPDGRDEWHCAIGHHTMWAESLPLAICRAALAATEASDA